LEKLPTGWKVRHAFPSAMRSRTAPLIVSIGGRLLPDITQRLPEKRTGVGSQWGEIAFASKCGD
jgi:hypothetical protein